MRQDLMDDLELCALNPAQRSVVIPDLAWDAEPDEAEAREAFAKRIETSIRHLVTYNMAREDEEGAYHLTNEGLELAQMMIERQRQRQGKANGNGAAAVSDEEDYGHHVFETSDTPLISTMSLKRFAQKSREAGYEMVMTDEQMDTLDLNSLHEIRETKVFPNDPEHGSFARSLIHLKLKPSGADASFGEPMDLNTWLDFSLADADLMMSAYRTKPKRGAISGNIVNPMPLTRPRWAASRSFDYTFDHHDFFRRVVQAYILNSGFEGKDVRFDTPEGPLVGWEAERLARSSRAIHAHNLMRLLPEAQVLVVDPELGEPVIEHKDAYSLAEALKWAKSAILPYNPLYLDLEGPGGRPTLLDIPIIGENGESVRTGLRGAILYRDESDKLVIYPVGGDYYLHDMAQPPEIRDRAIFGESLHESYGFVIVGEETGERTSRWTPIKAVDTLGRRMNLEAPVWTTTQNDLESLAEATGPEFSAIDIPLMIGTTQYGSFGDTHGQHALDLKEEEVAPDLDKALFAVAFQVRAALNILQFAQASNVELVEAPVEPRIIKRAQKRNWDLRIARIVKIPHTQRRNVNRGEPTGQTRHYTHIHKVAAHTRHLQMHTRAAQNRPDLVTPCPRHGQCRKVAVREHFRGTGEYVAKTRILKA